MAELSPERWERVQTLFEQAVELTDARRTTFLDEACATDAALRAEVESLLATENGVDGFLAKPARGVPETSPALRIEIDRYRIIEHIGGGGMGEVYRAERADGTYEHHVAIKVLRRDLGGARFARRFARERQVLADLDHPGIVRLLDGGVTGDERPWLAMEHIDGLPIDRYCEHNDLDVGTRLRLFLRVGEAIEYAHQNLVIHRDIKPGNVLVTADGSPRVIDFGIALPLALGDAATMRTTAGEVLGTIAYMSPEQCTRGVGAVLDVRSDVYALGVMLYELLTGDRPHDVRTLTLIRAIEVITKGPVPRPSSVVPALRGDLDVILLKALEKDPDRRYPSVHAFTADIERFLRNEPIEARSPGATYIARKFIRRHRVGVAIATAVAVALVATASIAVASALRATSERERADARAADAEFRAYAADLTAVYAMTGDDGGAFRPQQAARILDAIPETRHGRWEWACLRSRCEPAVWSARVKYSMKAVAFSPDGARIITGHGSRKGALVVRDSASGALLMSFGDEIGHRDHVRAVAWSADGRMIAGIGSTNGRVRVWAIDGAAAECVAVFEAPEKTLEAVMLAPDASLVYAGGLATLTAWALDGSPRKSWSAEGASALALAVSADGACVAAGDAEGVVVLRDARSGRELRRVAAHDESTVALAIEGNRLHSLHQHGAVCAIDLATMTVLDTFTPPRRYAAAATDTVALAANGAFAAMENRNGLEVWVPETGHSASWLMGARESAGMCAADFSPDVRRVAVGTWMERRIHIFDRTMPGPCARLEPVRDARRLAIDASSTLLAVGALDGTVTILDLPTGLLLRRLERGHGDIRGLGFAGPDAGRLVLASREEDAEDDDIEWWDLGTGERIRREPGLAGVRALAVTSDGVRVAYAADAHTLAVVDGRDDDTVFRVETGATIRAVGFSPGGGLVVAIVGRPNGAPADEHGVLVWNVPSGRLARTLVAPDVVLDAVLVFDDGRVIAGGQSPDLLEWPAGDVSPVVYRGTDAMARVNAIALSADGATLAISQTTGPVRLIDAERLQDVLRMSESSSVKHDGVLSGDGRYLVHAMTGNGVINRWDRLPARAGVASSAVRFWYDKHSAWPPVRGAVESDPMLDDTQRAEALTIVERLAPWFAQ